MNSERHSIEKCRKEIEEKLGWGSSTEWQNQDFEILGERIYQETKVSLSVSTLKRFFGKVNYQGSPNPATLNTLVRFLGYENWRSFASNRKDENHSSEKPSVLPAKSRINSKWIKAALVTVIICLVAFILWSLQKPNKKVDLDKIVFSSNPVTSGVPNTVVFQYAASQSNADSVFIQQNWDARRRTRVDKNLSTFTSTYFTPGYFRAKLILDTTIAKEHDVFIETNGWLGTIDRSPIPIYAPQELIPRGGIIQLPLQLLTEHQVDLEKEKLWTSFYRVKKEEVFSDQSFQMNVTLRHTLNKGAQVCQNTQIILLGTEGAIMIPLSIKGCVGELKLLAGHFIDGRTHDLSAFGVDFKDWISVQCQVRDKKISIRVNDNIAYEGDYFRSMGNVVGAQIRFLGLGEVKEYKLTGSRSSF